MLRAKIESEIRQQLELAVTDGILSSIPDKCKIEQPDNPEHGDWSINVAMMAAKAEKRAPRDIATDLVPRLENIDVVKTVDIAGPGFLNLFLDESFTPRVFVEFIEWLDAGGKIDTADTEKILLEMVSANPTGPLHVGHGRGAAVGDSVARLLRRVGHEVMTEYYVNDAGNQMNKLGESLLARVRQHHDETYPMPDDGYQGEYLIDVARTFVDAGEHDLARMSESEQLATCREYAATAILNGIRDDLRKFRVRIDNWRSEQELYDSGIVHEQIDQIKAAGYLETRDGALWFQSDQFGDEKPRVVVRENGEPTYFAADIAYHKEKFDRGFERAIDFWGADHHGYEPRVRAALKALQQSDDALEIRFIQFVTLIRDGESQSMSTRTGQFETLADVYEDVGIDAARFFYLLRRPERHLEFDMDLARTQANDNPVYYIQYAHARVHSLLRQAAERGIDLSESWQPADLAGQDDRELLTILMRWPEELVAAADDRAPHQIVYFLQTLAAAFHGYYNKQRILDADTPARIAARLQMSRCVGAVIADGLETIGVTAPEQM